MQVPGSRSRGYIWTRMGPLDSYGQLTTPLYLWTTNVQTKVIPYLLVPAGKSYAIS